VLPSLKSFHHLWFKYGLLYFLTRGFLVIFSLETSQTQLWI